MTDKLKKILKLGKISAWGLDKGTDNYHPIPLTDDGEEIATKASGKDLAFLKCTLAEILEQLKIMNTHLSMINDEVIEES